MALFLDMGEVFIQSVFSALILFFLAKVMGFKQILQFTYFDYIVGITVGSIAASMSFEQDIPVYRPVIGMIVYTAIALLISYASMKNIKVRRYLNGAPIMIIEKGRLLEKNMKTVKLDINDFLSHCRHSGYFNIDDIEAAVMETNGDISFLPKSDIRPVCPKDLSLKPKQEILNPVLIIDGILMVRNLEAVGLNDQWLRKQLHSLEVKNIKDILFGTLDENNQLSVYMKGVECTKRSVLE